jgi:NAD(P)H-flavin reductase
VLVLLARSADEVAYAEELQAAGIRVLVRVADGSVPPPGLAAASWEGRRMDGEAIRAVVPDVADREVYISGSPASVASLRRAAKEAGARKVHVDSFSGY